MTKISQAHSREGTVHQDVFVDSWTFSLGDTKLQVRESEQAGRLVSTAADLESAGFRWHHICEPSTTAYDLAKSAMKQLDLNGVNAILYATCIPANGNLGSEDE